MENKLCPFCHQKVVIIENPIVESIYQYFQEKINKRIRLTQQAKVKIKTRLQEYNLEEIRQAIDNFSKDKWWMENNSHRPLDWFFKNESQIDKWLNLRKEMGKKTIEIK